MEETPAQLNSHAQLRFGQIEGMTGRLASAIDAAKSHLFSTQHADGYWCGELEADTTLEAEYVLMHTLLGTGDAARLQKACRWMFDHQNEDGGWPIYKGGPSEISATVLSYFALKVCGYCTSDPRVAKAQERIEKLGGPTKCNTYTKIYLCFFGQYEWWAVPAIPPEIVLFPNWFWFNIYEISSWSRAIFIPLAIVYAKKPYKKLTAEQGIQELFPGGDMHNVNLHLAWDK
ncbi:MAG TPA: prenyltransferase/squalene oxidase repeat-containing protein, partial [Terriglobales bacterium]|nr:prenyltransferase/squalene oxidase repeat-containing protein [Terriglobales bacterium]